MRINIREGENERLLDLPAGYRQTSHLRETGEQEMDDSNEQFILRELRALEGVKEGTVKNEYTYSFDVVQEGDWYYGCGCVVYKCDLDNERFSHYLKHGWIPLGEDEEEIERPVLALLIEIKRDLENYPVLDDDDYYERCHEAQCEMVESNAPTDMPLKRRKDGSTSRLTKRQQSDIVYFLESDDCDPQYSVEWSGSDDYHIGTYPYKTEDGKPIYLEDCVKYAIKALKMRGFRNPRKGQDDGDPARGDSFHHATGSL